MIKEQLEEIGIKNNDTLMVHSSLKAIGMDGQTFIDELCNYLNNGLLIFPTHTWGIIKEDGQIFDIEKTPSNVGMLTNIALNDKRFKRSFHPTHSVCAYGKNRDRYLACDLLVNSPVSPKGCFGVLRNLRAKILFVGAPLSKNTFVHSIEEASNVPNRFTEHRYHFITKFGNKKLDYYMPRHFNKDCPHISDNYEKLLPFMLKYGIAKEGTIGYAKSYLVDAFFCYKLVRHILRQDIHAFDDKRDIDKYLTDFKKEE